MNPDFRKLADDLLPAGDGAVDREAVEALVSALSSHRDNTASSGSSLFDHPLDLVVQLDSEGTILEANESTCEKLGIERSDLVGENVTSLHPLRRRAEVSEFYRAAQEGGATSSGFPVQRRDGTVFPTLVTTRANPENSEIYAIIRDVSDQRQVEEALKSERSHLAERVRSRTAELSAANAELGKAARLKDQFLAGMSHELRTPLNAILGVSEALKEGIYGAVTQRQMDSLNRIEAGGRHLLELINDILDVAKIEAGELQLDLRTCSVGDVCRSCIELVSDEAKAKSLSVELVIDPAVETIRADQRRLKQILVNLLSNAVKFTDEGMLALRVSGDQQSGQATFSVEDSGIGISEDEMKLLFKPFVQINGSRTRKHSGTGLGLSIVFRLAELHGGSITLDSEVGHGSTFVVALPWSPGTDLASALADERNPAQVATTDCLDRVLVVEDSPDAAEQLTRYLSEQGVTSVISEDGETALLTAQEDRPDVIILDLRLPGMSGWDVLDKLKSDPATRDIPVIIASVVDERAKGFSRGASEYLVKPITRPRMKAALDKVLLTSSENSNVLVVAKESIGVHNTPYRGAPLILIAEDNDANIETVSDHLQSKGYIIEIARNGQEAIDRTREVAPDLILMDIQMPVMNGFDAIEAIKADPKIAQTPIIALTSLAMPGDSERCFEAGAADYVSQPVILSSLAEKIKNLLADRCLEKA